MSAALTFAVVGAGAAGGLIAARLAESGHAVTVLARGESLAAIRRDGLRLTGPDGRTRTVHPAVVAAPGDPVDAVDVTIFLVKSYDSRDAIPVLGPLLGAGGYVLCLQNGVDNEGILAESVGAWRVLPGVLYVGADRLAPGSVSYATEPRIVFGRGAGDRDAPLQRVATAFADAGIEAAVEADILAAKWRKFVFNCGLNPLTAITGLRLGAILADRDGEALFAALVDEAVAAGAAAGAPVGPDTRDAVFETARRMDISSSMAEDLAAGRPMEIESFCGYVGRLGRAHAVPTPVTEILYGLLKMAAAARAE